MTRCGLTFTPRTTWTMEGSLNERRAPILGSQLWTAFPMTHQSGLRSKRWWLRAERVTLLLLLLLEVLLRRKRRQ